MTYSILGNGSSFPDKMKSESFIEADGRAVFKTIIIMGPNITCSRSTEVEALTFPH